MSYIKSSHPYSQFYTSHQDHHWWIQGQAPFIHLFAILRGKFCQNTLSCSSKRLKLDCQRWPFSIHRGALTWNILKNRKKSLKICVYELYLFYLTLQARPARPDLKWILIFWKSRILPFSNMGFVSKFFQLLHWSQTHYIHKEHHLQDQEENEDGTYCVYFLSPTTTQLTYQSAEGCRRFSQLRNMTPAQSGNTEETTDDPTTKRRASSIFLPSWV